MLSNLDYRFYFAIFLRRLPYFLVIVAFISAIGITVAYILPPVYRSSASILVEQQQIPDQLAQTTVPVNPYEQAQIIEQRLMTRVNLLALAERVGLYDDEPEISANAIVSDMRDRVQFLGFSPDVTQPTWIPGAMIIGVAFEAPDSHYALKGANELVNLVLQENVRLRTGRAEDTLEFFRAEAARLAAELERKAEEIATFKTANVEALPDSLETRRAQQQREQERLLALEREESALRNQRATVVWVFERTGQGAVAGATSPEEEELRALRSQLIQRRAVYVEGSPQVRILQSRIAALESLVEEQRAARAVPDAEGEPREPMTQLELELAPIDARLEFIEQDKALIAETLAELHRTIQATPNNEMILSNMEIERTNLQRQYDEAVAALGQAQVGERIEVLSKGERFSLIEPPTEPGSPVRPRRTMIAGAGVVGGIGTALGFILLLELLNRSIRRPVDLSSHLGIQPLATVPYIRTRYELRRKRGILAAALLAILVAIPAGLFVLHSQYLPLDLLMGDLMETIGLAGAPDGAGAP